MVRVGKWIPLETGGDYEFVTGHLTLNEVLEILKKEEVDPEYESPKITHRFARWMPGREDDPCDCVLRFAEKGRGAFPVTVVEEG